VAVIATLRLSGVAAAQPDDDDDVSVLELDYNHVGLIGALVGAAPASMPRPTNDLPLNILNVEL
jgi:hypothetical protein